MVDTIVPNEASLKRTVWQHHSVRWGKRLLFGQLAKIRHGRIIVADPSDQWSFGA